MHEENHHGDPHEQVCILRGGRFDICLPDLLQCTSLPQVHLDAFTFFDLSAHVHLDLIANSDTRRDDKLFYHNSKTNTDPRFGRFFRQLSSKMGPSEPLFYRLAPGQQISTCDLAHITPGRKRSSVVAPWGR